EIVQEKLKKAASNIGKYRKIRKDDEHDGRQRQEREDRGIAERAGADQTTMTKKAAAGALGHADQMLEQGSRRRLLSYAVRLRWLGNGLHRLKAHREREYRSSHAPLGSWLIMSVTPRC